MVIPVLLFPSWVDIHILLGFASNLFSPHLYCDFHCVAVELEMVGNSFELAFQARSKLPKSGQANVHVRSMAPRGGLVGMPPSKFCCPEIDSGGFWPGTFSLVASQ